MKHSVGRRSFVLGAALAPAIIGKAQAATTKLKVSSSLANDPKYANGRVYYDNLVKQVKANGLGEQIENAPVIRCDEASWRFLFLSFAGWNAVVSAFLAGIAAWGAAQKR